MNASLHKLMQRISEMRDDELLVMVHSDPSQYRLEALAYAKAEINRRGLACGGPTNAGKPPMPLASITAFCNRLGQAIRDGAFHLGFVITLVVFRWLDYRTSLNVNTSCDDCFTYSGFPFNRQMSGGFAGVSIILWPGFIGDVAIAVFASVCIGWVFMRVLCLAIPNRSKECCPGSP